MKKFLLLLSLVFFKFSNGQELYPYSEPASNMPSKSISLKLSSIFEKGVHQDKILQRHMPELMVGVNKELMLHAGITLSNMHQEDFIFESARVYGKWRFLSNDGVHKHFRMAAFTGATYSRNHLDHNEINLMMGDQSGVQAGLIATQLWNKFALSVTGSWNEVLDKKRNDKTLEQLYAFQAINYSLSAGYLLFPIEYVSYDQTNVNLYTEILGSRNINFEKEKYFIDLAPSLQFIFKSTSKLNLGYRFHLAGDIYRLSENSIMVSYEHIFLNALKKKKQIKNPL